MTGRASPDIDPSWPHYFETILEMRDGERLIRVDLRKELSAGMRDELRGLSDSPTFGVVTAANPLGSGLSYSANARRSDELGADLAAVRVPCLSADGASPDGAHREEGFAVWSASDYLRDLAEKFEQTAFFWFDGTSFWLVATRGVPAPIRLPRQG
jgi:hypothetical protein